MQILCIQSKNKATVLALLSLLSFAPGKDKMFLMMDFFIIFFFKASCETLVV